MVYSLLGNAGSISSTVGGLLLNKPRQHSPQWLVDEVRKPWCPSPKSVAVVWQEEMQKWVGDGLEGRMRVLAHGELRCMNRGFSGC